MLLPNLTGYDEFDRVAVQRGEGERCGEFMVLLVEHFIQRPLVHGPMGVEE